MSIFQLCSDDPIVKILKNLFEAYPVKVPEERIKPLIMVARDGKSHRFIGDIKNFLNIGTFINVPISISQMADVSGKKSKEVSVSLGLEILDGFLKGFNVPSAEIKAHFEGASKVSFSFNDVKRYYVDLSNLGQQLSNKDLDLNNPSISPFIGKNALDFLLIDSIITSSDFSISIEKKSDLDFKLNIPAIQNILSQVGTELKINTSSDLSISFKGPHQLTFAFSCFKLKFDNISGKIKSLIPVFRGGGLIPKAGSSPAELTREKVAIEDGLLIWD